MRGCYFEIKNKKRNYTTNLNTFNCNNGNEKDNYQKYLNHIFTKYDIKFKFEYFNNYIPLNKIHKNASFGMDFFI